MLSRSRLLFAQGIVVIIVLVLVNQVWFTGFVDQAEFTVTGAQALSGLSAGLVVQLLLVAIAFYLPGRLIAALSVLPTAGTLWFGYLTIGISQSATLTLAASSQVSKLSGQSGPASELARLINEPTTSPAIYATIFALAALAIAAGLTVFAAPKWQTTKRAKATQAPSKSSFDLWDSQR